jgi:hypothetical protein
MSWDPNQGESTNYGQGQNPQGQDPYSGYGGQQNPYGAPQNPYGAPPPQNPYEAPQNPYGTSQNPYGTPQNPYNNPQSPYGSQSSQQYSAPNYQPYGYGTVPAPAPQTPVSVAIQQLPNQYRNVLTHPSDTTFAEEMGKADWQMVLVQIFGLAIITAIIGMISALLLSSIVRTATGSNMFSAVPGFAVATTVGSALSDIILVPLFFFIGVGIQYLLAKAFNGQGTYLAQSYTHLLFKVPLDIINLIIGFILVFIPILGPIVAGLIGLAIFIYSVVLNVFQIKAVHRLTTGKAAAVVLIPYAVILVLGLLCAVVAGALFVSLLHMGQR